MLDPFKSDRHPGAPRILFVGDIHGSHALSWISMLKEERVNIRGFGSINGVVPADVDIPVYSPLPVLKPNTWHRSLFSNNWHVFNMLRTLNDIHSNALMRWAFLRVLRRWKPDVVHTFGLLPASEFYLSCIDKLPAADRPAWIAQARGGPDIVINRLLPQSRKTLTDILQNCDYLVADTDDNYEAAVELGLRADKIASIGRVPGTGGINLRELEAHNARPPSQRERLIIWPKAYEHIQSKGLPVLEALKLCWSKIQPCQIILTAVNDELLPWIEMLPQPIRSSIQVHARLPRPQLLNMMSSARLMLAPSILDGLPNAMFEAMAMGTVPVISPIPTITRYVRDPDNVFLARNLYPQEIADALVRAMSDEADLDGMAKRNLALVNEIASMDHFRPRIINFYREVVQRRGASRNAASGAH